MTKQGASCKLLLMTTNEQPELLKFPQKKKVGQFSFKFKTKRHGGNNEFFYADIYVTCDPPLNGTTLGFRVGVYPDAPVGHLAATYLQTCCFTDKAVAEHMATLRLMQIEQQIAEGTFV